MFSCISRAEREKQELQELLEQATSSNQELKKYVQTLRHDKDLVQQSLIAQELELTELKKRLETVITDKARTYELLQDCQGQLEETTMKLRRLQKHADEESAKLVASKADNAGLVHKVERLGKDKEHLKQRVERMQKALSMLENVLDDTLQEPANLNDGTHNMLRQSQTAVQELLLESRKMFQLHNAHSFRADSPCRDQQDDNDEYNYSRSPVS